MSRILSATLGRISPKYRTFSEWTDVYRQIVESRSLSDKTIANRRNSLKYLVGELGPRSIGSIRPHDVAQLTRRIYSEHPSTARRVLIEARDAFSEAVAYGWIHTNPAAVIRHHPSRVTRLRLSIADWQQIYGYAQSSCPPWVSRMLVLALVTGQRRSDLQKMRFDDVRDGFLHVQQQKTGAMLRLPLALRLDAIDVSIKEVIESCRDYAKGSDYLLRKSTGKQLVVASLSARFEDAREGAMGLHAGSGSPPSLHECRSLSERLYRKQGVDTKTLLGHKHQSMTDAYNDDRGLSAAEWKTLEL